MLTGLQSTPPQSLITLPSHTHGLHPGRAVACNLLLHLSACWRLFQPLLVRQGLQAPRQSPSPALNSGRFRSAELRYLAVPVLHGAGRSWAMSPAPAFYILVTIVLPGHEDNPKSICIFPEGPEG